MHDERLHFLVKMIFEKMIIFKLILEVEMQKMKTLESLVLETHSQWQQHLHKCMA